MGFLFVINSLDFLQNPKLKKTVRGELCLPITVFRYPSTGSGRTEN
ncbi:hypothetical protein [Moraxella lacunata]